MKTIQTKHMRILFLFLALTGSLTLAVGQKNKSTVDKRLEGVDAELQKVLATWQTPGFAVAVVEKNKIVRFPMLL